MKDYIKINQAIDKKNIQDLKENMQRLKVEGGYPKRFTYPTILQFELTGQCNLACKHCYNRSGDEDRETLMTPDKWCELARQIVKDGGIFQCIISGGEPLLLGDKLFDIMDILHDDGTSFVVITNAFLLTPEKVKRFVKYRYFWFQVSIDGHCADIHDSFRGVPGSWKRAVYGALEISHAGIPLVIAHSVTPQNLPYVDKMVELSYQLGANSIILGEILPSGRAFQHSELLLSLEQRNYLYSMIAQLSKEYAGKISINRTADLKIQMQKYAIENNSGGIIRPNGDFRLDCMAPFIIGNILKDRLKDIWINKGIDAWHDARVTDFINSIQFNEQHGNIPNHVGSDILL
ncbi:radical SAM/SPASM domain-containing protein [Megasphaera stantonii]|uniref:radical SAM/SPASM domain-containing protein n=1 Tax=Megasphaera stantonii TaxID=2144175 RepID=UPI00320AFB25